MKGNTMFVRVSNSDHATPSRLERKIKIFLISGQAWCAGLTLCMCVICVLLSSYLPSLFHVHPVVCPHVHAHVCIVLVCVCHTLLHSSICTK
jgi:hypothetical protein